MQPDGVNVTLCLGQMKRRWVNEKKKQLRIERVIGKEV